MVHRLLTLPRRSSPGFTLPELVIVIVVVSIAAVTFSSMFIEAVKTYQFIDVEKDLLQDARYAEERIARELKRVKDSVSVTAASATTLAFVDRDDATVSFSWSGVSGAPLLYTKDGSSHTLARGVDSLAFQYWKQDGAAAAPVVAPSATDVWRVTVFLRLIKGSQTVSSMGAAFMRSL
jgi:prepilin-type N-terminal cleavage/methylation domain-containing protein